MTETASVAPRAIGLTTLANVVVAPRSAFASLRECPTWGWAFIATSVSAMGGALLLMPESEHALRVALPQLLAHEPSVASLSAQQLNQIVEQQVTFAKFIWLLLPLFVLIAAALSALVILIVNIIVRGDGTYRRYFALAMNIAFITWGIGSLVRGLIATLRGPESFNALTDLATLLPSPAWFALGAGPKLLTLLGYIEPFSIWTFVLLIIGIGIVGSIRKAPASIAAAIVVLSSAIFAAASAR